MAKAELDPQQFANARSIAQRWDCHVDTVFSRLDEAGVPKYRFTARLVRWRWADIYAFEASVIGASPLTSPDETVNYVPRKRGPRNLRVVGDG